MCKQYPNHIHSLQHLCFRCVSSAVDLGIARFPNSFVAPVILGIVSGKPLVVGLQMDRLNSMAGVGSIGGVLMNLELQCFGRDGGSSTLYARCSHFTHQ